MNREFMRQLYMSNVPQDISGLKESVAAMSEHGHESDDRLAAFLAATLPAMLDSSWSESTVSVTSCNTYSITASHLTYSVGDFVSMRITVDACGRSAPTWWREPAALTDSAIQQASPPNPSFIKLLSEDVIQKKVMSRTLLSPLPPVKQTRTVVAQVVKPFAELSNSGWI